MDQSCQIVTSFMDYLPLADHDLNLFSRPFSLHGKNLKKSTPTNCVASKFSEYFRLNLLQSLRLKIVVLKLKTKLEKVTKICKKNLKFQVVLKLAMEFVNQMYLIVEIYSYMLLRV